MIVLTREDGEAEKLAQGAPTLQRRFGMPIDPAPYPRPASSEPACRAVVATRLHAPGAGRGAAPAPARPDHAGRPARRPGAHRRGRRRCRDRPRRAVAPGPHRPRSAAELEARRRSGARPRPTPREHSTTSWAAHRISAAIPPRATSSMGSPSPGSIRSRPTRSSSPTPPRICRDGRGPQRRREVLRWADEPLATAEVALIMQSDIEDARRALGEVGRFEPAGADGYWTLRR